MAQYKVPQDVEADDKLLGPFSFRQFVYLLVAGGLIALAVAFFQIFPVLAIVPVPFILFFAALALPLKKDQPMETYLAAIASFYLKPRKRIWTPGQRDSTITIAAPKIEDDSKARDITGEEATHRLSFLANIVDTEGQAIKGGTPPNNKQVREDLIAEANATYDMFETGHFDRLGGTITRDENERHEEVIKEMRDAIDKNENMTMGNAKPVLKQETPKVDEKPNFASSAVVVPTTDEKPVEKTEKANEKEETETPSRSIIELANNPDFSVATIAKEANRIKEKEEGEVFISLH